MWGWNRDILDMSKLCWASPGVSKRDTLTLCDVNIKALKVIDKSLRGVRTPGSGAKSQAAFAIYPISGCV